MCQLSLSPKERANAKSDIYCILQATGRWTHIVDEIAQHEANGIPPDKRVCHERAAVKAEAERWMNDFSNGSPDRWLQAEINSEVAKIKKAIVARARVEARKRS